jgi:hypothetical protein
MPSFIFSSALCMKAPAVLYKAKEKEKKKDRKKKKKRKKK